MRGAIDPVPQYAFMVWCWVKAQGQLYLLPLTFNFFMNISLIFTADPKYLNFATFLRKKKIIPPDFSSESYNSSRRITWKLKMLPSCVFTHVSDILSNVFWSTNSSFLV